MTDEAELLRVLHIEGGELDPELLTAALRQVGRSVQIRRVATTEEIQAALRDQAWDVVLSDDSLPTFDAVQELALLRQYGLDLPFIIVSATIDEVHAVHALRAGAHDFITEENLVRLAPAIERELREAETRRQQRQAEGRRYDQAAEKDRYQAWILANINDAQRLIAGSPPSVTRRPRCRSRSRPCHDPGLASHASGLTNVNRDVSLQWEGRPTKRTYRRVCEAWRPATIGSPSGRSAAQPCASIPDQKWGPTRRMSCQASLSAKPYLISIVIGSVFITESKSGL